MDNKLRDRLGGYLSSKDREELMQILTTQNGIIPVSILKAGGIMQVGTILCSKCHDASATATCAHVDKKTGKICGNETFFIRIYWKRKNEDFRRNVKGATLSRKEADDILLEINLLIKAGRFDPEAYRKTRRPFEEVFEEYIAHLRERVDDYDMSPGSVRNIEGYVKKWYSPLYGKSIWAIDGDDMTAVWKLVDTGVKTVWVKGSQVEEPIKTKTKKNIINGLHSFYYDYVKKQPWSKSLEVPPFPIITKKRDKKKMRAIEKEAQAEIIGNLRAAVCSSCRPDQRGIPSGHADPHEFMHEVGIRECELCLIKVGNVDLDNGLFWMDEHLVKRKGVGWVIWPSLKSAHLKDEENDQDGRWVPMTDRAVEIARKHSDGRHGADYLFINPFTNNHYNPDQLYRAHHRYSGSTVTVHEAARHTHITNVMEKDIGTKDAMVITGISSEKVLKGYNHTRKRKVWEVMQRFVKNRVSPLKVKPANSTEKAQKKGG